LKSKEPHHQHGQSRAKPWDSSEKVLDEPAPRISLYDAYLRENNLKDGAEEAKTEKARRKSIEQQQSQASDLTHHREVFQILEAFPSSRSQVDDESSHPKTTDASTTSASASMSKSEKNVLSLLEQFPVSPQVATSLSMNNEALLLLSDSGSANACLMPYHQAIETMKRLCDLSSPRDKVACITRATNDIVECVRAYYARNSSNNSEENSKNSVPSVYALLIDVIYLFDFGSDELQFSSSIVSLNHFLLPVAQTS
jgi:hypothetical protein